MKDIKASTREYKANFIVRKDEDGISCAADLEQEIFADFDISPGDVDICIWLS
ncbi:hypothetical protein Mtc_1514 [Methanocella conradii HZ254]|uniref:Uncharacterized protein n=1 Tax=Methanocella conradii (strain DSM 24694 / JCM 17849 / CGMCC 1.5162 / HZ254) TaxID=1041930 RepID=H8I633_METCZ|nr:hypothetical protein [Methanocella conradii]AFD00267.1 hypothetical protein Mtc_1514 [Methanocella conradii HZ254]